MEPEINDIDLLEKSISRLREQNRNIMRNFIAARDLLLRISRGDPHVFEITNEAERLASLGCECIDVEIGSYDNQVQLTNLPPHMKAYKEKAGGNPDTICVDKCIAREIQQLWAIGITTTGCCCGHNRLSPYIGVIPEDIPRMKELGYQVQHNPNRPGDEDTFYSKTIKSIV